ncbi:hypothetical protein B0F90DRAFT_797184 [Multifurca ochricompacta]|uniref:DUF7598 domain-containing protein n=1 Tax=Multifurca ochricompacta TaxID=376703 RepID=A0AAD4MAA7_9AGAM|nr:hypothetical protein B0F90DRAFT_797184 [Multifurca ochricompacta]
MLSRSYLFYGLNVVRALSIVALLLAFSSSIVVVVSDIRAVNKFQHDTNTNNEACGYIESSTVPNQPAGVFWAVLNRLFIIFQLVFLLLSEVSWPVTFFDRFFPVVGSEFGLGALGVFQGLIGATILSHHVDGFTLVSAFFLFSVGCLNIALGLIFREHAKSKRSIRGWRESDGSALPVHTGDIHSPTFRASLFGSQAAGTSGRDTKWNGFGFGKQGEKQAGLKGFMISKPMETTPRHASRPASVGSLLSVVESKAVESENMGTPKFRSSPTAI